VQLAKMAWGKLAYHKVNEGAQKLGKRREVDARI
jgi:hypothetical protein